MNLVFGRVNFCLIEIFFQFVPLFYFFFDWFKFDFFRLLFSTNCFLHNFIQVLSFFLSFVAAKHRVIPQPLVFRGLYGVPVPLVLAAAGAVVLPVLTGAATGAAAVVVELAGGAPSARIMSNCG